MVNISNVIMRYVWNVK